MSKAAALAAAAAAPSASLTFDAADPADLFEVLAKLGEG